MTKIDTVLATMGKKTCGPRSEILQAQESNPPEPKKTYPISDSQTESLAEMKKRQADAQKKALAEANAAKERDDAARRNQEREIAQQERIKREGESKGQSRSPLDNDLFDTAKTTVEKEESFPKSLADKAENPDLRRGLQFIAVASEAKEDYKRDHAQLLATIAQLSQMALTTAQRAQNLGAVDPKSAPAISTKATKSQNAQASKIAETKPAISANSNPEELTAAEVDQASNLTEEQKAKLKTAIEAAAKRKQLMALKQRLKNKLSPQSAKKDLETEEATSAFNLDLIPDEPQRSIASTNPEKEKEDFLNSAVFHAMQAQFSMDGGQTRAEVERMLDEVERELGSTGDILAGILGTDSKSLFERIKEAHLQCLRENCVFAAWKNRVP